jgi:bacillolysin
VIVNSGSAWRVAVDALNGAILAQYPLVMDAAATGSGIDLFGATRALNLWVAGGKYYLDDTTKQMYDAKSTPPDLSKTRGVIAILDASNGAPDAQGKLPPLSYVTSASQNSWSLKDGVSAAFNLSKTYDYYLTQHQRASLDGDGNSIVGIVRFRQDPGAAMENAFWSTPYQAMFFGNARPLAGATDVIGHELTHGVTEHTAGLVYKNQSGALNEAISDIFGEMVEARTKGTAPDWLTGGPPLNWVLRDFINPNNISCGIAPCPKHMREFIQTQQDNGGVHENSSIINHAYYLLAAGLPGAVGLTDAEKIFYRMLTTKLLPQSEFIDARRGAIAAAQELFGATATQVSKVQAAFDAVGITDAPPTPEPPPNTKVNGPDSSVFAYWNGFGYYLARRETAKGDGTDGVYLSWYPIAGSRPSVAGNGSLAVFVNANNDICYIPTDGSAAEQCLGYPGSVSSVALSRDQGKAAFVFLDALGQPENRITVIDLKTQATNTYTLTAPVMDGGTVKVLLADAMEFTADSQGMVYDAYNILNLKSGSAIGLWSIYHLDLTSGAVVTVAPPTPGFDLGNPSIGKTADNLIAYEAVETATGKSTVIAENTFTAKLQAVATITPGPLNAAPSFTGDDRGLVYATSNVNAFTGSTCVRQPLDTDHLTPSGPVTLWVDDGAYCVVYRRGTYTPPQRFILTVKKDGTGTGVVNSVPSGVVCGAACAGSYPKGSKVTLTATADPKSQFAGWSGPADCADGQVTVAANATCVATFNSTLPVIKVVATDNTATEAGLTTGLFTFTRTGSTATALKVNYKVGGTATAGSDYQGLGSSITFPIGGASVARTVKPLQDTVPEPNERVVLTLSPGANYGLDGAASSAKVVITSDE